MHIISFLFTAYPPQYNSASTYPDKQGHTAYPMPTQVVHVQPQMANPPNDYLILSILNTIFCCFWIGLVAIYKSVKVRDYIRDGKSFTLFKVFLVPCMRSIMYVLYINVTA